MSQVLAAGSILFLFFAAIVLSSLPNLVRSANAATSFVTVDAANQPYGITCDSPGYVYMALNEGGKIARIDKGSKTPILLTSDDGGKVGKEFYNLVYDATSNSIFVNEETTGWVWKYNIASNTWKSFLITEDPSHRTHTFQQLAANGGTIWSALGEDTSGGFAGLAKIDALTLQVTRIPIEGAYAPSAIEIDGNILWIADRGTNELYKFDLQKEIVLNQYPLPVDSLGRTNVHDMVLDSTFLYVALGYTGYPEDGDDNSLIAKIRKSNPLSQAIIDTGAYNDLEGTWGLHLIDNQLYWSDNSGHVGVIDLGTNSKLFEKTGTTINNNYFGCSVGSDFWWAAHGSAKIGIMGPQAHKFEIIETAKVKDIANPANIKDVKVTFSGSYSCDPDMHIIKITKTVKGSLTIDGNIQTAQKINFKQVADNAFTYSIIQSWGKVNGKSTFLENFDCHNEIGSDLQTIKNTMTLAQADATFKQISTTDKGIFSFN